MLPKRFLPHLSLGAFAKAATVPLLLASIWSSALAQGEYSDRSLESAVHRAAVNGGEIEYEVREGPGDSILFIPGAFVADAFHPLMDQPSLADYRLINIHRRGYAGSSVERGPAETYIERHAEDSAAVLRDLDVAQAHIVGQSSGALIALQLALDSPELVKTLTLLEPPHPSQPQFSEDVQTQFEEAGQAGNLDELLDLFVRHGVGLAAWKEVFEEAVPGSVAEAQRYSPTFFQFEGNGVAAWTLDETKVRRVQQPILYMRGGESPMPEENADAVRAWFPQTEVYVVPNATHSMHMEAPQRTAERVVTFVQEHQ